MATGHPHRNLGEYLHPAKARKGVMKAVHAITSLKKTKPPASMQSVLAGYAKQGTFKKKPRGKAPGPKTYGAGVD